MLGIRRGGQYNSCTLELVIFKGTQECKAHCRGQKNVTDEVVFGAINSQDEESYIVVIYCMSTVCQELFQTYYSIPYFTMSLQGRV
jgi:hypothetical protein